MERRQDLFEDHHFPPNPPEVHRTGHRTCRVGPRQRAAAPAFAGRRLAIRGNGAILKSIVGGTVGESFLGTSAAPRDPAECCGSSSGVEHHVANVGVEGSNPFSRSGSDAILGWRLSLERSWLRDGGPGHPDLMLPRGNASDEHR